MALHLPSKSLSVNSSQTSAKGGLNNSSMHPSHQPSPARREGVNRGFAKQRAWLTGLVAVLWLLCAPWAAADVAVPPLKARVTDLTGTLQPDQQAILEQTLQAFENKKGSQIAVLIVPTTQP